MVKSALEAKSEMADAHKQSVGMVVQSTNSQLDLVSSAIQSAIASTASLGQEIEYSHLQTASIAARQESLEKGMIQLASVTQSLMANMSDHTRLLAQASNLTNDMLDTLEATAAATSTIQNALSGYGERAKWWPFVVCPMVSLVMGSYGLPPSIVRNIGLLTFGEMLGVMISSYGHFRDVASAVFSVSRLSSNTTAGI
ncbi:hypothetical protein SEPCBS57363_003936 [Sporothrix epigloea]|uniref:Uncharacterized protein n=1 Tax=Sporothrix epigloea TaxID=1892477 RepID=A0ABP0DT13_9PEZI